MNKLVSKNPIQRFKEGRKIVKAQGGTKVIATVDGRQFETTIEQARKNRWEYFIPSEQAKFNRNYPYDRYSTEYRNPTSYLPAFIQDARFGDYVNGWTGETSDNQSGLVRDLETGNLAWWPKTVRVPYVPTQKSQSNLSAQNVDTQNVDTQNTQSKTTELQTQSNSNFQNNKSGSQKSTKGKSRKTSTPSPIFAGYRIGKTGGLNYSIDDADKQQLIGTGQFTESDFKNATSAQKALNRYFVNSGLGSVKEDGAWGDQSRAALAFALSKSKGLTPLNNETTVIKTPIVPTYTPPTTPVNQEATNLKLNVNVPQQTYDRTGVREFIRNKGINPYSFSGAQRRALRMVLNNTADDNDKLLVKGMGLFKKGGQLLSRNPIERFKSNFR